MVDEPADGEHGGGRAEGGVRRQRRIIEDRQPVRWEDGSSLGVAIISPRDAMGCKLGQREPSAWSSRFFRPGIGMNHQNQELTSRMPRPNHLSGRHHHPMNTQ